MTAGDNPQRLRSAAALAHLCGAAPIPASRAAPTATGSIAAATAMPTTPCGGSAWSAALPPTHQGLCRAPDQAGLSKLDILRCLKRYLAREIYQHLTSPPPTAPPACLK
jgi:transposase